MTMSQRCWACLILAIAFEICGTGLLKFYTMQGQLTGYVYMAVFISVSYYLLSLAMKKISLSLAYAFWEGVGLIGTTAVAYYIFQETITPQKFVALTIILLSLMLIKKGTTVKKEAR